MCRTLFSVSYSKRRPERSEIGETRKKNCGTDESLSARSNAIIFHRIHVCFYSDPLRTFIRVGFLHVRTQRRSALIFKTIPLRARFSTRGWKQNKNGKPTTAKTARGMGVKKKIIAVTTKTTPTSGNTIRCHHGRRGTLCATCFSAVASWWSIFVSMVGGGNGVLT